MKSIRRRIAALGAVLALGLTGCGVLPDGTAQEQTAASADEFCRVLKEEQGTFTASADTIRAVVESGGGDVVQLAGAGKAVADASKAIEKLDATAPSEIKSDIHAIRQTIQDISSGSMDPTDVQTRAEKAWAAIQNGGHLEKLRSFGAEKCGVQIGS